MPLPIPPLTNPKASVQKDSSVRWAGELFSPGLLPGHPNACPGGAASSLFGKPKMLTDENYLRGVPGLTGPSSVATRWVPSSATAAKTIPWDKIPISLTGLRFATIITCLPTRSSGL
jgi:hypothetical protein